MPESTFRDKTALITGAASGIGAAIARELGRCGAEVVLADRQIDLAEKVAAEIRASGGRAVAREVDVRSFPSVARIVEETVVRLGGIDLFFNNAGIGVGGEMDTYDLRDWDDVTDVNLRGVTNGVQAVYPLMLRQGRGHIVNTASVAGLLAMPIGGSYTATKHAVVGLSKALRLEAKRRGVRVSVLCPGVVRTPILSGGKYGRAKVEGLTEAKALALWEKLRPIDADVLAREALRAVSHNEAVIVIPGWWKALWLLDRLAPPLSGLLWEKILERTRRDLAAVRAAAPRNGVPIPESTSAGELEGSGGAPLEQD